MALGPALIRFGPSATGNRAIFSNDRSANEVCKFAPSIGFLQPTAPPLIETCSAPYWILCQGFPNR